MTRGQHVLLWVVAIVALLIGIDGLEYARRYPGAESVWIFRVYVPLLGASIAAYFAMRKG